MNTQEFIKKANKIHHNFYDYSLTEFVDYKTKVKIIDIDYGVFEILPSNHLNGQGCPKRKYRNRPFATQKFIQKVQNKRNDLTYDYSQVNYVHSNIKVNVICNKIDEQGKKHGEFKILPNNLITEKCPCPKCYKDQLKNKYTLTNDKCIVKLYSIYGDELNYTRVNYKHNKIPIIIGCNKIDENGNEHGFYEAKYCNLQRGLKGCPKCQQEQKAKERLKKQDNFINKAKEIHNDKYNYSNVKYVSNNVKVCIICPEHGEFWQRPSDHLAGKGCTECAGNRRKTIQEFITESNHIHKNKYNYNKSEYVNWQTPLCIICPEHGEFWQTPIHHIQRKQGCPLCKQSKLEKEIEFKLKEKKILYVAQCRNNIFKWLGQQSLDFYLPDYNIAIECQGIQHFEDVKFFNSVSLEKRIELDNIKILYYTNISIPFWIKHKELYYDNIDSLFNHILTIK